MVSDQEPRYRLVDANGNIVGSLYGKDDGSIAIQETASGSDREVTLAPDGTFSAPSGDFDSVSTEVLDIEDDDAKLNLTTFDTFDEDGVVDYTISFPRSLNFEDFVWIMFETLENTAVEDIEMTEDGDNGPYGYRLVDGTKETGEDSWVIQTQNDSFPRSTGVLEFAATDRPSIGNMGFRIGRDDRGTHIDSGFSSGSSAVSSITIANAAGNANLRLRGIALIGTREGIA